MPVSEHRIALPARYRLVRHIANGGMASVWAAEDELLGRLVAVKVLAAGYAQDERANRRWLREAREALHCAHRHDVVHRDVKPANLLIDERGRLAVGDFGIATVAAEASLTQTGQVLGTAAYISPEQARGQAATDASDRYALAVVAFELLT